MREPAPDAHDFDIMARTIFGEARGEPEEGQIAIAHVILNRWNSGRWFAGKSLAATCLKRLQFSCWNAIDPSSGAADPNYRRIIGATYTELKPYQKIAIDAYRGDTTDPTGGATHYYADTIAEPKWAKGQTPTAHIGHHLFFKGVA